MIKKDKKEAREKNRPSYLKKIMSSIAITALLLPNVVSVGMASAEEMKADEPEVEETLTETDEEPDTSEEIVEEEKTEIEETDEEEDVDPLEKNEENDEEIPETGPVADEPAEEEVEFEKKVDHDEEVQPAAEETYTVTIDPGPGDMNDEARETEVEAGEIYTLPHYSVGLGLFKKGHTVTGYTVEGTLLNADGEAVTEIPTYSRDYTLGSDVKLTANWEVTTGKFTLVLNDEAAEEGKYSVNFTNLDNGASEDIPLEYVHPGDRVGWEREGMPYGHYKLSIDGFKIEETRISGWQMDKEAEVHEDGTATVYLEYEEGYPANFAILRVYGETLETYSLGMEVRDLDNQRTSEVDVEVADEDGEVFTGTYNEYKQWFSDKELLEGSYTITLDTPTGTVAEINDTVASQHAVATDEENVFTIDVNEENQGSLSAVFAAFRLVERETATYPLGVVVLDMDGRRTSDVGVEVTDEEGSVFTGSYNQYTQWIADEDLPEGLYTIALDTPTGTIAEIDDTAISQRAVATDEENIFTIEVNEENLASLSRIYGAFKLVEKEVATYPLGVEVRDLEDKRTSEVGVEVTDEDGEVFTGTYNEYKQWFSDEDLPEGLYTITLDTPTGTVAEINDTVALQHAVATDEENVFTIEVNAENQGSLSAVFAAFRLVEDEEDTNGEDDEPNGEDDEKEEPNGEDQDDEKEEETDDSKEDTDDEKDMDEEDTGTLPKTGSAAAPISLGIASILTGLGVFGISRKRKKE